MSNVLRLLACCLAIPSASSQETVTIVASRDNTLYEDPGGGLSNGSGSRMFVGESGEPRRTRGLVRFELAGLIPPGSTVTSVTFEARVEISRIGAVNFDVHSLHRLTADWGEGASVAGMGQAAGGPSAPGDATWIHTRFPGSLWATPGGDFEALPSASYPAPTSGPVTVTAAGLAADVQLWVDDPLTNHGWILKAEDERSDARGYASNGGSSITVVFDPPPVVTYCSPAVPNSTGGSASISAAGSTLLASNDLILECSGLPTNGLGHFIIGTERAFLPAAGGSEGALCVGGEIGRLNRTAFGEILDSGTSGRVALSPDLASLPGPGGVGALLPGVTRTFQYWYRDQNPGATSNFSSALEVLFR